MNDIEHMEYADGTCTDECVETHPDHASSRGEDFDEEKPVVLVKGQQDDETWDEFKRRVLEKFRAARPVRQVTDTASRFDTARLAVLSLYQHQQQHQPERITMELKEYAVNGADKYWPIEIAQYDGRAVIQNRKFWTLTLHDPHCRYAQRDKSGLPLWGYAGGDSGLRVLAEGGLKAPTSLYADVVWQGCKVCGTASQPNENWKARGQKILDAEKAYDARRREQRRAQDAIDAAKDAFNRAQSDARGEWIKAHESEIIGVELEAAAAWVRDNPELALLLDK